MLRIAVIALGAAAAATPATAQERPTDWPTRPVTMVVPYAAGGTTDVIGRILSPRLSEILGQQGIVVARRTVAKYRESLQILPVNLRKTL